MKKRKLLSQKNDCLVLFRSAALTGRLKRFKKFHPRSKMQLFSEARLAKSAFLRIFSHITSLQRLFLVLLSFYKILYNYRPSCKRLCRDYFLLPSFSFEILFLVEFMRLKGEAVVHLKDWRERIICSGP